MSIILKTIPMIPGTAGGAIATLAGLATDLATVSQFALISKSDNSGGAISWGSELSNAPTLGDWSFPPVTPGYDLTRTYLKTGAANDIVYLVIPGI